METFISTQKESKLEQHLIDIGSRFELLPPAGGKVVAQSLYDASSEPEKLPTEACVEEIIAYNNRNDHKK